MSEGYLHRLPRVQPRDPGNPRAVRSSARVEHPDDPRLLASPRRHVADDVGRGAVRRGHHRPHAGCRVQPGRVRRRVLARLAGRVADHDAADGRELAGERPAVVSRASDVHLPAERGGDRRDAHRDPAAGVQVRHRHPHGTAAGGGAPGARRHGDSRAVAGGHRVPALLPGRARPPWHGAPRGVRNRAAAGVDVGHRGGPRPEQPASRREHRRRRPRHRRPGGGGGQPPDGAARRRLASRRDRRAPRR